MTPEEELIYKIKSEYILLINFDNIPEIEEGFNKHLKEYKDLTGHDFQLEDLINKLNN